MKVVNVFIVLLTVLGLIAAAGCSSKKVTRISEDSVTDLSGNWNDTDSRLVAEEMISDCLSGPWKTRHWEENGEKPVVIVGIVQNKSSEHIAIDTFIGDMERAFINTGEVTVVASKEEREQIRDERQDQQTYSSEESMKRWGREIGADYMLGGTISSITDQDRGDKVIFYQVDLTLIDLESNEKVWLGQKKIKKYIERASLSY
ncbi:MAG: penicillin-binding protein activator LpoB [Candidatus Latescibacterota bacterium]|nr:MAG: penicillin-binding protein activator LpoB [Candidatus Latescibacterota bacterium]